MCNRRTNTPQAHNPSGLDTCSCLTDTPPQEAGVVVGCLTDTQILGDISLPPGHPPKALGVCKLQIRDPRSGVSRLPCDYLRFEFRASARAAFNRATSARAWSRSCSAFILRSCGVLPGAQHATKANRRLSAPCPSVTVCST